MNDISIHTIRWAERKLANVGNHDSLAALSGWLTNMRSLYATQERARALAKAVRR